MCEAFTRFRIQTYFWNWLYSLTIENTIFKPKFLGDFASSMNSAFCFRTGMYVYSHLFMKQMKPRKPTLAWLVHEHSFLKHSKSGSKGKKKSVQYLNVWLFLEQYQIWLNFFSTWAASMGFFVYVFLKINSYIISSSLPLSIPVD